MTTYKYKSFSSFCWPACSWHLPLPINHMFLMLYFVESKQPFISSFFSCFPRCESRCRSLTAINSSFDDEEQHEGSRGGHFGNAKVAGAFFGLSFMVFKGSRMSLNAEDSGNKSQKSHPIFDDSNHLRYEYCDRCSRSGKWKPRTKKKAQNCTFNKWWKCIIHRGNRHQRCESILLFTGISRQILSLIKT